MVKYSRDYKGTLAALESLILKDDKSTRKDEVKQVKNVEAMADYISRLSLDISKLSFIHVAGTKGKGSTCAFCESVLRNSGYKTGLYISPHLIDVRERIRINGEPISKDKFIKIFWECWDKLQETRDMSPEFPSMATYFRFLTLVCFKAFIEEKVDVAILEVGLGGRLDATNVIQNPVACGISALGLDHVEILGNTLDKIAFEKAGIMKKGSPVVTSPQKDEAMAVLIKRAKEVGSKLYISAPLEQYEKLLDTKKPLELGLAGTHQRSNAALALALCGIWLQRTSKMKLKQNDQVIDKKWGVEIYPPYVLPKPIIEALRNTRFDGRCQQIQFPHIGATFYLDGAHTVESLNVCKEWFLEAKNNMSSSLIKKIGKDQETANLQDILKQDGYELDELPDRNGDKKLSILVFNCTGERNPGRLLATLVDMANVFDYIIFCPTDSSKVSLQRSTRHDDKEYQKLSKMVDAWNKIIEEQKIEKKHQVFICPSINHFLKWLWVNGNPNQQTQVLVTGSLYLVGDFLQKIAPQ